jgi:hypothetical protein
VPGHEVGRVVCGPEPRWQGWNVPVVTGPRESHPLEVQGTQAQRVEGTLCNKTEGRRGGASDPERQPEADPVEFLVDASALGRVGG